MATLLITLPMPGAGANDLAYVLLEDAVTPARHGQAPASRLPRAASVTLLAPAQALSWHRLSLPRLGGGAARAKTRAVLDGLMEDLVLDDTASLHFALHPAPAPARPQWVCACDKAWLQGHVRALQDAGLPLVRIAPEAFPLLDGIAPELHIGGSPAAPWALLSDANGVLCAPLSAVAALRLLAPGTTASSRDAPLASAPAGADPMPSGAARAIPPVTRPNVSAEPAVAALAEQALRDAPAIVTAHQHAARCAARAAAAGWDLAQFDLALSGRSRWSRDARALWLDLWQAPRWRGARIGLAALLGVNLLGLNAWAWHEGAALQAKRAETGRLLTQTFPKVKVVLDAPLQMRREVSALRQASGQLSAGDMEALLGHYGMAFGGPAQRPGAVPAPSRQVPLAIDFSSGKVSLKVTGVSAEQVADANVKFPAVQLRLEGDRLVMQVVPPGVAP